MSWPRLSVILCVTASCQAGGKVEDVLASMDGAAASFRSLTASIKRLRHTAIIDDTSEEHGSIRVLKTARGVMLLIEFSEPDPKVYTFFDRKAEIFYPKIPLVDEYDLGKHKTLVDQYLLLGFGTAGRDVSRNYAVRMLEGKTVDGRMTHHLELTSKVREVAVTLKSAELWIADPGGYAVQQKFVEKSGNYMLVLYSDLKLNGVVTPESLRLKLPPGVKRQHPMK